MASAPRSQPDNDLKSRLAAIAKNIETLEHKVTAGQRIREPQPAPQAFEASPAPEMPVQEQQAHDPLEALRRRKRELETNDPGSDVFPPEPAAPAPAAEMIAPAVQHAPTAGQSIDAQAITDHLDAQFARLTNALSDVRALAQSSASEQAALAARALPALESLPALQSQVSSLEQRIADQRPAPSAADGQDHFAQLSAQVEAVQQTLANMPAPQAMKSLEEGYRHILLRLDELKDRGTADEKVDALYGEVTALREALDGLAQSGTGAVLDEMRSALTRLENEGSTDQARVTAVLEEVSQMARGMSPQAMHDSMGVIVERLVALEARIEAITSGDGGTDETAARLDAIQNELGQLTRFREEIGGLHTALDSVRQEVREAAPAPVDMSLFDTRFSAIDRIEQATGGYADQIGALAQRLEVLDGGFADQSEIVRQVAALSRQVDTFTNTIPVREIEQALLDLTGRVTALQENDPSERLSQVIHDLNARVDACIAAIPGADALVEAVEARLEPHLGKLDIKVDGIYSAITADDAPIIEHIAARVEKLIAEMPGPRADQGLADLEQHIIDLNKRYDEAGMLSRDEVRELSSELARVRASVELGTNNDLQKAIAEQVQQLADNFDSARAAGDASMLPAIERHIEDLSKRIDAIGASAHSSQGPALSDEVARQIQLGFGQLRDQAPAQTFGSSGASPEVGELRSELISLRKAAQEQDSRLHETLGSVQGALETVIARIENLESDDKAASSLVQQSATPVAPLTPPRFVDPRTPEPPTEAEQGFGSAGTVHQPGDAQDLLRQLSGAMSDDTGHGSAAAEQAEPKMTRAEKRAAAKQAKSKLNDEGGAQRASFIAAARRAAQAAALQAASGAQPGSVAASDAVARLNALDAKSNATADDEQASPIEPGLTIEGREAWADPDGPSRDEIGSTHGREDMDVDLETGVAHLLEKASASRQSEVESETASKPKRSLSRAAVLAIGLLVVGATLLAAGFLFTGERQSTVVAPLAPAAEQPTEDTAVRIVGEGQPVAMADDAASSEAISANMAAEAALEALAQADAPTDASLSAGFQRGDAPIMESTPDQVDASLEASDPAAASLGNLAETPSIGSDAGASLGPMSGLTPPALPAATADSLPEAIGSPRLRVAAAGGDPLAQFEIAVRYTEGRFVPQDFAAAAYWYGQSAEQGVVPAAYRLATFYEQGRGIERDPAAAIAWYELAAAAGNPRAMHNLAVMAAEGRSGIATGTDGPDFQRAAAWFEPAAARGLSDSQFNLAVLYARGMGVERDLMQSYQWFALAALAGDEEAVTRRDEVAAVLGEEALALASARTESWQAVAIPPAAVVVPQPEGGWDDAQVRADAGASRDMIAMAQSLLAERGYDPGPADGLLGPRTNEAVRAFRQSIGLEDSAQIDAALLDALRQGSQL